MYSRYAKLRDEKGLKDADVARGSGLPAYVFSDWKRGKSTPKTDKLKKIADFFDVSLDYLTGSDGESVYYINPETAHMAQQIYENKELRALFSAAKDSSAEDLKVAHDMLLALKRKERGE